jgi:two-component system, OmpR family, sensor histidine kinase KdpD
MTERARPDPDLLLEQVTEAAARAKRGRLKVFLGAAPGVGKTVAMLEAAHLAKASRDVVVGVVETHGRSDTARLLEGMETLPRRRVTYRGTTLDEFDLDAALVRRPELLLVDELAHTNAPGSRHAKRWQDVEELLDAGLNVWTTCNVQHVDSLNDIVAQITGVVVRETVPDQLLDRADEVELVDVSPEVLEQRLRDGKVYQSAQAARALEKFFRRGNLIALRELALRRLAERVDADMAGYRSAAGIDARWPATERLLVSVDPARHGTRVVRQAALLARRLKAEWSAVYVETPQRAALPEVQKAFALQALALAESLGADPVTVPGSSEPDELLAMARARNVTGLVVGKGDRRGLREWFGRSRLDQLLRAGNGLDVHVVTAGDDDIGPPLPPPTVGRTPLRQYVEAAVAVAGATTVGAVLRAVLSTADIAMVYLLVIVAVGARARVGPAVCAAVLATVAFDFFFVPPYFTLAVADQSYLLTFGVMFAIGLLMVRLTSRLRAQTLASREREARTAALYALGERLAGARRREEAVAAGLASIRQAFDASAMVVTADQDTMRVLDRTEGATPADAKELAVAQWVHEHGVPAGLGTETLAAAQHLWLPIGDAIPSSAVLGLRPADLTRLRHPETRRQLDTMVRVLGAALDRIALARDRAQQKLEIEAEQLRTSLLSSLSHDLRTPLAGIEGAATTLLDGDRLEPGTRRDLAQGIADESRRLTRLVANLLDMVRVESESLMVQREWQPVEEVIGAALARLDILLEGRPVSVVQSSETVLAPFDAVLIEQVLANLLENVAKHTPPDTAIAIEVVAAPSMVTVSVHDAGPGVPPDQLTRIFDKFHRSDDVARGGVGLGLAICRAIVVAHGGRIWAERPAEGGLAVRFTLPMVGERPTWPVAEPPDEVPVVP